MLWRFWGGRSPGVRPDCPAVPLPTWGHQRRPLAPHWRRTNPRILCNLAGCHLSSSCSYPSSCCFGSSRIDTFVLTNCPDTAVSCPDYSTSPRSFASSPDILIVVFASGELQIYTHRPVSKKVDVATRFNPHPKRVWPFNRKSFKCVLDDKKISSFACAHTIWKFN